MAILLIAVALNFYLLAHRAQGLLPRHRQRHDLRAASAATRASPSSRCRRNSSNSSTSSNPIRRWRRWAALPAARPPTPGNVFVTLKPPRERGLHQRRGDRPPAAQAGKGGGRAAVPAIAAGGIRAGGRQGNGDYQYTILGDTLDDLNDWVPKITAALQDVPELEDVNSDQQDKGLEIDLKIDRATAARLGLNAAQIDNTLYDAFGQRQVSTIYKDKNQYHVVMEVAPAFWQSPETLHDIFISTSGGAVSGTQSTAAAGGAFVVGNSSSSTSSGAARRRHVPDCRPRSSGRDRSSASRPAERPGRGAQPAAQCRGHRRARRLLHRRQRSRPGCRPWCRCRPLPASGRAPRRWRSITRACSSPPPSPSACRRA